MHLKMEMEGKSNLWSGSLLLLQVSSSDEASNVDFTYIPLFKDLCQLAPDLFSKWHIPIGIENRIPSCIMALISLILPRYWVQGL